MKKAETLLAMAGAFMAMDTTAEGNQKSKYPLSGGRKTDYGKLLPGQFKKRKRLKRLENKARAEQHR
jgi:hypothetical protein